MYSGTVEVQLYPFFASTPGTNTDRGTMPTEEEDSWVRESVWAFWKREKSLAPVTISALFSDGIGC